MKFQFILLHLLTSYKHNDHFLFIFLIKKKQKKNILCFRRIQSFCMTNKQQEWQEILHLTNTHFTYSQQED